MPTAEDYRTGIVDLDRRLETIARVQLSCEHYQHDFGFEGGVSGTIADGINASSKNAKGVGAFVDALLAELHRRALLCEQFTRDMEAYLRDLADWRVLKTRYDNADPTHRTHLFPGPMPQPPQPPFPGAKASR